MTPAESLQYEGSQAPGPATVPPNPVTGFPMGPRGYVGLGNRAARTAAVGGVMEAYCLKCREKREMRDPQPVTMKNGKPATMGVCPECGTKMYRIGKAQTAA